MYWLCKYLRNECRTASFFSSDIRLVLNYVTIETFQWFNSHKQWKLCMSFYIWRNKYSLYEEVKKSEGKKCIFPVYCTTKAAYKTNEFLAHWNVILFFCLACLFLCFLCMCVITIEMSIQWAPFMPKWIIFNGNLCANAHLSVCFVREHWAGKKITTHSLVPEQSENGKENHSVAIRKLIKWIIIPIQMMTHFVSYPTFMLLF